MDMITPETHYGLEWLAHDLLPGFGCFGPRAATRRVLPVNGKLKRLVMYLDNGSPQDCVMPRLVLFNDKGREIPLADAIERVLVLEKGRRVVSADTLQDVLSGSSIRLESAPRPELTIIFKGALFLSRIELANRPGIYGPRNRHLCIDGYLNERLMFSRRLNDPAAKVAEFVAIHQELGLPLPDPRAVKSPAAHGDTVRQAIFRGLEEDRLSWSPMRLLQLLPLGETWADLTPWALRIAAEAVLAILGPRMVVSTPTLAVLLPLMGSPGRIERVMEEASRIASRRAGRTMTLCASKHSVQEPVLIRRRDDLLATLDAVFPAFEACGVQGMLCYGTLLGAVREGSFLSHDDDVDLLYFDGSTSREEMLARREELKAKLAAHGFRYVAPGAGENIINFHVANDRGRLDLFPSWAEGDKLHVMLKYPTYVAIPRELVLPLGKTVLHGHSYPAPAQPEAFLATRYGDGWATPDPYYEWPWPVDPGQD